jgi:hypothetical protein
MTKIAKKNWHSPLHEKINILKYLKFTKEEPKFSSQKCPISQESSGEDHKNDSSWIPSLLNAYCKLL